MKELFLALLVVLGLFSPFSSGFGSSLRCAARSSRSQGGFADPIVDVEKLRRGASATPPNFKVAFFGDQGLGEDSKKVLEQVRNKKVDIVLHAGDYDYDNNPAGWDEQIDEVLGENYPYFASIGNHDSIKWGIPGGYQSRIEKRLQRINATSYCTGEAGVKMACNYNGFLFVLSGVGSRQLEHPEFFDEVFTGSDNIWRAVTWHKNQRLFQCGGKFNAVGYGVYDTGRKHGAIIATAHEHSYCRTHLMSDFSEQEIASTDPNLVLSEGRSFSFVSGLGGRSIREYKYGLENKPWWAATAAKDDGVSHGPLICTFNINGDPRAGECEFEDLNGVVWDKFKIYSNVTGTSTKGLPCTPNFHDLSVDFSEADCTEEIGSSTLKTTEKILKLGGDHLSAFYFHQTGLKKNAKISEVHLQFMGAKETSTALPITIRGLKGYPLNGELISSFETTKAKVSWLEEDDDWEVGTVWVSPDITPIIEELIAEESWKEGDPISFVVSGPGERLVYSFDRDDCLAPSLSIEYKKQC